MPGACAGDQPMPAEACMLQHLPSQHVPSQQPAAKHRTSSTIWSCMEPPSGAYGCRMMAAAHASRSGASNSSPSSCADARSSVTRCCFTTPAMVLDCRRAAVAEEVEGNGAGGGVRQQGVWRWKAMGRELGRSPPLPLLPLLLSPAAAMRVIHTSSCLFSPCGAGLLGKSRTEQAERRLLVAGAACAIALRRL